MSLSPLGQPALLAGDCIVKLDVARVPAVVVTKRPEQLGTVNVTWFPLELMSADSESYVHVPPMAKKEEVGNWPHCLLYGYAWTWLKQATAAAAAAVATPAQFLMLVPDNRGLLP